VQTILQLEKAGPLSIEVMVYVLALCIEVNRARWKEIETLLLGIFIGLPRLIFAVKSWFRHSETLSGFVLSDFYS
jgi:hypothetical protein